MPKRVSHLLIAYIAADNDLSTHAATILRRMRRGTELYPEIMAIALVDQLGFGDTRLVVYRDGQEQLPRYLKKQYGFELDLASPRTLGMFLRDVRKRVKARRTFLTLIGHGTGPVPACSWLPTPANGDIPNERRQGFPYTPQGHPLTPQGHPLTPQGHPLTPGDLSSGRTMSTPGLGRALQQATGNGKEPFDVLLFDQCFQGNIDVLYEFHEVARVFIASPNYGWLRAAYVPYMRALVEADRAESLASRIITLYQRHLDEQHPNAIFWVRGVDIPKIAQAISALGERMASIVREGDEALVEKIWMAVQSAQYVDTGRSRGQYELGVGDELLGAASLAQNLRIWFTENDGLGVYNLATALLASLQAVHSTHRVGHPYVAPEQIWAYTDSITLLAPRHRLATNRQSEVWRASLYVPQDNFIAAWGPDPKQTVTITQNLRFVHEGSWHRFIAAWYVNALTPTVGQPNYVNVRAFPLGADVAEIGLTGKRTEKGAALRWAVDGYDDFVVFRNLSGQLWEELGIVDRLEFFDSASSVTARYRVASFDEDGVVVALSNTLEV